MVKKLPIINNPGLSTECYHNCRLSILFAHTQFHSWIRSHFINLKVQYENPDQFPMVRMEEHLDIYSEILSEELIQKKKSWIESFISNLEEEKYILVFLNWRLVPSSKYFMKEDIIHEAIIYGYNDKKKIFSGMGFDVNGKTFGEFEIPFSELDTLVENTIEHHLYKEKWFTFYGFPAVSLHINYYPDKVVDRTKLFFALDRSTQFDDNVLKKGSFANGHYVYLYLFNYFREIMTSQYRLSPKEYGLWNIIQYKLLQHKKLNIATAQQLLHENRSDCGDIIKILNLYDDSKRELTNLRRLSLKYQQQSQKQIIDALCQGYYKVYEIEKRIHALFKNWLVQSKINEVLLAKK